MTNCSLWLSVAYEGKDPDLLQLHEILERCLLVPGTVKHDADMQRVTSKSALSTNLHHGFRRNSLTRLLCLLCYLCPEALFQSVPFLRDLAPPYTFCERRSRDGEIPVNPAGIWSARLWTNSSLQVATALHCSRTRSAMAAMQTLREPASFAW